MTMSIFQRSSTSTQPSFRFAHSPSRSFFSTATSSKPRGYDALLDPVPTKRGTLSNCSNASAEHGTQSASCGAKKSPVTRAKIDYTVTGTTTRAQIERSIDQESSANAMTSPDSPHTGLSSGASPQSFAPPNLPTCSNVKDRRSEEPSSCVFSSSSPQAVAETPLSTGTTARGAMLPPSSVVPLMAQKLTVHSSTTSPTPSRLVSRDAETKNVSALAPRGELSSPTPSLRLGPRSITPLSYYASSGEHSSVLSSPGARSLSLSDTYSVWSTATDLSVNSIPFPRSPPIQPHSAARKRTRGLRKTLSPGYGITYMDGTHAIRTTTIGEIFKWFRAEQFEGRLTFKGSLNLSITSIDSSHPLHGWELFAKQPLISRFKDFVKRVEISVSEEALRLNETADEFCEERWDRLSEMKIVSGADARAKGPVDEYQRWEFPIAYCQSLCALRLHGVIPPGRWVGIPWTGVLDLRVNTLENEELFLQDALMVLEQVSYLGVCEITTRANWSHGFPEVVHQDFKGFLRAYKPPMISNLIINLHNSPDDREEDREVIQRKMHTLLEVQKVVVNLYL